MGDTPVARTQAARMGVGATGASPDYKGESGEGNQDRLV